MLSGVEINALEKRWKAWKLKSLIKISSIGLTALFLIVSSWLIFKYLPNFFSRNFEHEKIVVQNQNIEDLQKNSVKKDDVYENKNRYKNENPNPTSNYYPQEDFHEEVVEDEPYYTNNIPTQKTYTTKDEIIHEDPSLELEEIDDTPMAYNETKPPEETLIQIETQKPKISIESSNIQNYTTLKERFYETENIIFALMLAEEYYHNKDYKNALKWSIRANNLNSTNERSWIIFAKSLAKNGSIQKAIDTLKAYLRTNPEATEIASLIEKIKYGTY